MVDGGGAIGEKYQTWAFLPLRAAARMQSCMMDWCFMWILGSMVFFYSCSSSFARMLSCPCKIRYAWARYLSNFPFPFVRTAPIKRDNASSFRRNYTLRLLFYCYISITSSGISQSLQPPPPFPCTTLPKIDSQSATVLRLSSRSITEAALLITCLLFCTFSCPSFPSLPPSLSARPSRVFSRLVVFCLALRALLAAGFGSSERLRRGILPMLAILCLLMARTEWTFWSERRGSGGRRGMSASWRLGRECAALLLLREMPFWRLSLVSSTGQVWQGWLASFILEACKAAESLADVRLSRDSRCLQQFLISSSSLRRRRSFSSFSCSFWRLRSSTCRSSSAFIQRRLRSSCCCSLRQNSFESSPRLWLRCQSSFIFYLSNMQNYYQRNE